MPFFNEIGWKLIFVCGCVQRPEFPMSVHSPSSIVLICWLSFNFRIQRKVIGGAWNIRSMTLRWFAFAAITMKIFFFPFFPFFLEMCPWIFSQVQSFHRLRFLYRRNNSVFIENQLLRLAAQIWIVLKTMISNPFHSKTKIWKISMSCKAAWRSAAEQCQTRMKNSLNLNWTNELNETSIHDHLEDIVEKYNRNENKALWTRPVLFHNSYRCSSCGHRIGQPIYFLRALSLTPLLLWILLCLRFFHSFFWFFVYLLPSVLAFRSVSSKND